MKINNKAYMEPSQAHPVCVCFVLI